MNNKIFKNKNFLSVFLALIVFIITIFFYAINLGAIVDKNIQKIFYNFPQKYNDKIVVVKIDETTVGKLGRFPFDRKEYIPLIKNLNKAGATVIGFDIIFADKTPYDNDFAKAIVEAGNIVLGGGTIKKTESGVFEEPRNIFKLGAINIGFFDVRPDNLTNTVFSLSPYKDFSNGRYEYFGISLLRAYYSKLFNDKDFLNSKSIINNNSLNIKNRIILPFSKANTNDFLINYNQGHVKSYSFYNIYSDENFIQNNEQQKDFLKDKIVIIGSTIKGLDTLKTPIGDDYGVYVHANFLNTVLTKNFSKYFEKNLELLLIFLISILAIYINLSKSGKKLIFTNISILGILLIYFLYLWSSQIIPNFPFELILAILLSSILSNITKYILENKDKNKLNTALSEYVSKDVAAEILSGEGNINLDGEKKRLAILFSDIEGFTTISEKFSPEKLISFLKEYLTKMSEVILNERGFINKYEGDAIMALWGVFGKAVEDISYEACITALIQKQRLIKLNTIWNKQGFPNINIRIGINVGDAIIGNIGSKSTKLEFTAIGDNVNLASRLESINKFYGTYICVSENVYQDTKDIFEFRYLDKIKVKGKNIAINIYELLDSKGRLNSKDKIIYDDFQKGIDLYFDKKFKEALEIFDKLIELGDKPSLVYKERCLTYMDNPPDDSWDYSWTMTEK